MRNGLLHGMGAWVLAALSGAVWGDASTSCDHLPPANGSCPPGWLTICTCPGEPPTCWNLACGAPPAALLDPWCCTHTCLAQYDPQCKQTGRGGPEACQVCTPSAWIIAKEDPASPRCVDAANNRVIYTFAADQIECHGQTLIWRVCAMDTTASAVILSQNGSTACIAATGPGTLAVYATPDPNAPDRCDGCELYWLGLTVDVPAICVGDLDVDGRVDAADLAIVLGAWGPCSGGASGCGACCEEDLTGDGVVDAADLGIVLGAWGACP